MTKTGKLLDKHSQENRWQNFFNGKSNAVT